MNERIKLYDREVTGNRTIDIHFPDGTIFGIAPDIWEVMKEQNSQLIRTWPDIEPQIDTPIIVEDKRDEQETMERSGSRGIQ